MSFLTDEDLQSAISGSGFNGLRIGNSEEQHIGPTFIHVRLASRNIFSSKRGWLSPSNDKVKIQPKESVTVETQEVFDTPLDIFGTLHSRVWLAVKDIVIPNAIVDPGYRGVLRVVITNNGEQAQELGVGDYIGKVMLYRLAKPALRGVDKQNDRADIIELHKSVSHYKLHDKLLRNRRFVAGIVLFLIVLASVLIYFLTPKKEDSVPLVALLVVLAQFLLFLSLGWK